MLKGRGRSCCRYCRGHRFGEKIRRWGNDGTRAGRIRVRSCLPKASAGLDGALLHAGFIVTTRTKHHDVSNGNIPKLCFGKLEYLFSNARAVMEWGKMLLLLPLQDTRDNLATREASASVAHKYSNYTGQAASAWPLPCDVCHTGKHARAQTPHTQ